VQQSPFAAQITPIVNRIEEAKRESRSLAALRDSLLPKLMSGELRVGEARDQIEEVA
jgi:type I restriction enzyme, S subunit